MKSYIDKALANPLPIAGALVLVLGVVYFLARKTVSDVIDTAGGALSGNNAVTKNQTNAAGEKVTAYEGKGILGTLGAGFNSLSGGVLASTGETIASWFSPTVKDDNLFYIVTFPDGAKHSIPSKTVDANAYFTYGSKRYRLGVNQANARIAVEVGFVSK